MCMSEKIYPPRARYGCHVTLRFGLTHRCTRDLPSAVIQMERVLTIRQFPAQEGTGLPASMVRPAQLDSLDAVSVESHKGRS